MKIKAFEITQGSIKFFAGIINASILINNCKVDELTADNPNGYQRVPIKNSYREFAEFMKTGISPPSIIVNIREPDQINFSNNILEIPDDTTLWLVDGQHRVFGLELLNKQDTEIIKNLEFPITITQFEDSLEEAKQFKIINTARTQVKMDLADRILSNIALAEGKKKMLEFTWTKDFDWKSRALNVIDALATNPESVWYDKVKFPNQQKRNFCITQGGFTDSLKILLKDGYFMTVKPEKIANIINTYWNAIKDINPKLFTVSNSTIQKNLGVYPLHAVLQRILINLHQKGTGFDKGDFLYYTNKIDSLKNENDWVSPKGKLTQHIGAKGRDTLKLLFLEEIENNIEKLNS